MTDPVTRYRKASTAQRGIRYRIERGQAGTRNSRATEAALANHDVRILVANGQRELVGALVEEAALAERIRTAPEPRPELALRLAGVRSRIRTLTKGAA